MFIVQYNKNVPGLRAVKPLNIVNMFDFVKHAVLIELKQHLTKEHGVRSDLCGPDHAFIFLSEVQGVLLGDLLVLLQKQDDKVVLKCQSKSNIAVQEGKQMLSPIIKLDSVFLRDVATGEQHRTVQ